MMKNKIERIKKKFAKIELYKQGGAVKPFYIGFPWRSCVNFTARGKQARLNYAPFAVYLKDDFFDVYFQKEKLRQNADFYYNKELTRAGFIADLHRRWRIKQVREFLAIMRIAESTDLPMLNDEQFTRLFMKFAQKYEMVWREAIFLDSFDVASDEILERALGDEQRVIKEKDLQILIAPNELSWLQRERYELLVLVKLVKRLRTRSPVIIMALNKHTLKWHWIQNDYAVIKHLGADYFMARIQKWLGKAGQKEMRRETREIAAASRARALKLRVMRRLKLSRKFTITTDFLAELSVWRDDRKAYTQMANGILHKFVLEIMRRIGLSENETEYLFWWEIKNSFYFNIRDKKNLRGRQNGIFVFNDPSRERNIFCGKTAIALQKFMQGMIKAVRLKGRPAFAGVARGRVKIILSQKEFHKMKKGDILVAPNTRPEYVPIMKLAGAMISEEGGLTCHTSIISRELKIPAIVGVQGAITALKDGDLVEVDANKGIVRKIKK